MAVPTFNLSGVTEPAAGYVEESTREQAVEVAICKDSTGVKQIAVVKGVITTTITYIGKGTITPFVYSSTSNTHIGETAVLTITQASDCNDHLPDYTAILQLTLRHKYPMQHPQ